MDGAVDVYGVDVSQLQSNITINESDITGTLNFVFDYTGFNPAEIEEQQGHYIALEVDVPDGATVTTELLNGNKGPVDLSADKFCVYRITDKDTQQIKFTVTLNGEIVTKVYSLDKLTVEEMPK